MYEPPLLIGLSLQLQRAQEVEGNVCQRDGVDTRLLLRYELENDGSGVVSLLWGPSIGCSDPGGLCVEILLFHFAYFPGDIFLCITSNYIVVFF